MRVVSLIVTVVALGSLAAPAQAQSKEWLDKGNISVKSRAVKGTSTPETLVVAVVDAAPEVVWRLVSDCAKYKKTMNRIASSKLLSQTGDEHICEVEIEMPFPLSNLKGTTRAKHQVSAQRWERSWSLIKGDYKFNNGSWVLEPFEGSSQRTLVTYRVHAEPTTSVPDWVRERAQKKSLPEMIERLRQEAKKLK